MATLNIDTTSQEYTRPLAGVLVFTPLAGMAAAYHLVLGPIRLKVQSLPWVPKDWESQVAQIEAGAKGMIARLCAVRGKKDIPKWIDTPAKIDAWESLRKKESAAISPLIKGQIEEARAVGDALESDVAFWDTVYSIDEAVATFPATAANAVSDGIMTAVSENFKKLLGSPATLVVGGVLVAGFIYLRKKS